MKALYFQKKDKEDEPCIKPSDLFSDKGDMKKITKNWMAKV